MTQGNSVQYIKANKFYHRPSSRGSQIVGLLLRRLRCFRRCNNNVGYIIVSGEQASNVGIYYTIRYEMLF